MSLIENSSLRPKLVKTFPKVTTPVEPRYEIKASARLYNMWRQKSASNSLRGIQFQYKPSSYDTIIRRDPRLHMDLLYRVRVRVAGATAAGDRIIEPTDLCLRDRPVNACFEAPRMTINNEQNSMDLGRMYQGLKLAMYNEDIANSFHEPSNIDLGYLNYTDGLLSNSTPLAGFKNASLQDQHVPDGAFPFDFTDPQGQILSGDDNYTGKNGVQVDYTNGIPVTANVAEEDREYDIYLRYTLEAVPWIPPFLFNGTSGLETQGLWGVNQFELNLPAVTDPKLIRSSQRTGDNPRTVTDEGFNDQVNSPFYGAELRIQTMLPPHDLPSGLPSLNILPQLEYWIRTTQFNGINMASGSIERLQTENYSIQTMPRKFMLMARVPVRDIQPNQALFHLVPHSLDVRIGNDTGQLKTFDQGAIYNIIRRYIDVPYNVFRGHVLQVDGTKVPTVSVPIILDVGEDLTLEAGLAPAVNESTDISISGEFENQTGGQLNNVELVLAGIDSAFLYTENGVSDKFFSFLTESDVLNASVKNEEAPLEEPVGGNAKKFLKSLGHQASKLGKTALPVAKQVGKKVGKKVGDRAIDFGMKRAGLK